MRYYYYLFYKFYKFGGLGKSIFPPFTKAFILVSMMELFIQISLFTYYSLLFGWDFEVGSIAFIGPIVAIGVFNITCFTFGDRWEVHLAEFEKWPVKKNNNGTWIVIGIVIFVVANFAYAIYLTPVPN